MRRVSWALPTVIVALAANVVLAEDQIRWQPNLETAQRMAGQTNRLVLVHFWAPSCKACVRLEKEVFSRAEVGRALETNFVPVKLNVDEAPATARMYGVASLPTDVILTPSGRFVAQSPCLPTANQYVSQLNHLADGHRQLTQGQQIAQHPAAAPPAAVASTPGVVSPPAASTPPPVGTPAQSDNRYAQYFNERPAAMGTADPQGQPQAQTWRPDAVASSANTVPPAANVAATVAQPPVPSYQQPYMQPSAPQQPPAVQQPPVPQQPSIQQIVSNTPAVQAPAGGPPLALDGYCAAALTEQRRWIPGDRRWGAIHRGRTYLFSGPEEQKRFLVNPDAYSPVISGNDPVLALDSRQELAGKREHGVFYNNRIYLFNSEQTLEAFNKNPNRYSAEIIQAMR